MKQLLLLILCLGLISSTLGQKIQPTGKKTPAVVYNKAFYVRLAKDKAKKYHIQQWHILYAIWWWESGGKKHPIHNVKGDGDSAIGMGQIWVKTARHFYSKKATVKKLLEVNYNADASAKILATLLEHFYTDAKGQQRSQIEAYRLAVAAYNAGMTGVDDALAAGNASPNEDYVNHVYSRALPF
jgi:soluble lytic murein transglycosylase-like protein